jgi:hypothetical protein
VDGLLDNDSQKQGLNFDGLPIFNPRQIIQFKELDSFVILLYAATFRTNDILTIQLQQLGLIQGAHFFTIGCDEGKII